MPRASKAEDAAYQRRYLSDPAKKAQHKASSDRNRRANADFRKSILASFSCCLCGECDSDLIDWHHINPDDKSFNIKGSLAVNHSKWWDEVLKCIPVCALCHRKIHTNKLCLLKSLTAYKRQAVTENIYVRDSTCPR